MNNITEIIAVDCVAKGTELEGPSGDLLVTKDGMAILVCSEGIKVFNDVEDFYDFGDDPDSVEFKSICFKG